MDNYTKARSRELPTYQAGLALSQTQAKIEVNGLFFKIQLLPTSSHHLHWHPDDSQPPQQGCLQVEPGPWVGSALQAGKPHLHLIKGIVAS